MTVMSVIMKSLPSTDPNIPSPPDTVIPDIYVAVGNDSIKAVTKNLTWEDARKECENDKANLASLRNEWTQAYVELLAMNLKASVWIGLNKEKVMYRAENYCTASQISQGLVPGKCQTQYNYTFYDTFHRCLSSCPAILI